MVFRFDAATKSRARAALREMAARGEGPRLVRRTRWVSGRGLARALLGLSGFLVALLLVGLGVLVYLLAQGPIRLDSLRDEIARNLQERAGERYRVSLGPTYLMHDSGGVSLGFGGLSVRDAEDRTTLAAPSGKLSLDLFALALFEVKVKRLELDGLDLKLRVAPDGALSIAAAADEGAAPIALPSAPGGGDALSSIGAIVFAGIEAMAGGAQALDRLTLAHGHFEIDNRATGRTSVYNDFAVDFQRDGGAAAVSVSASGPSGPWTIAARARSDARTLSLEARDLSLDDIRVFDARQPPFRASAPIGFKLDARLTPQSGIESLEARFSLGAGWVRIEDEDAEPVLIDEATGAAAWDPSQQRYVVTDLQIYAGATHLAANGWVRPPAADAPAWTFHAETRTAEFAPARAEDKPLVLDQVALDAHYVAAQSRFVLDGLVAHGPDLQANVKGETAAEGDGSTLKLAVSVGPSALADLIRLWPQFINRDSHDWASQHVHAGQVTSGSILIDWDAAMHAASMRKQPVPAESVRGEFAARDVAIDLLPGLPQLAGLEGTGVFSGREFSVAARKAVMEVAPNRRIQVSDVAFLIPNTTPAPIVPAKASARLAGGAEALADLLNRDALRHFAALSFEPSAVKGQFEGSLSLDLKLGKTAKPEDTQFHVDGALTNFQMEKFLANERLEQATLTVSADRAGLKIIGDGQSFGAATHVEIVRQAGDEGTATVSFALDAAARAKRGLAFGPWLSGALPVKLKAPLNRASAEVEIDLTHVAIDNPLPGIVKPAGKPGKATFSIKADAEGASLGAIALEAGPLSVRGSAQVGPDATLLNAKLTQFRLTQGDDLKVDVTNGAGLVKIAARGAAFDARPMLQALFQHGFGPGGGGKDLDLDLHIASLAGSNKQALGGFELAAQRRNGDLAALYARGRIGQGAMTVQRIAGGQIRLDSTDAGALVRFADLYTRMEGGTLALVARENDGGSEGSATVTNFVLRDEPAMRQLIAAGQSKGGAGAGPDASAARFQKMTVAFVRTPGRLEIKDAVIYQELMGLTAQGVIDFARGEVDASGTFVPAYQVNTLLTKIPLVGLLLGGGKDEGVFGVNYRVRGALASPTVSINPLSAITPGILRKIIGAIDGTTAPRPPPPADVGGGAQ